MAFTIYNDYTGTGTGDMVARVDTIEEAREIGHGLLVRDYGYSIFDDEDEGASAVQFVPRPSYTARQAGASAYVSRMNLRRDPGLCPYPAEPESLHLRRAWVAGWEEATERRRDAERNALNELLG